MDETLDDAKKRIVFISKSDLRGGAAIVTFRLVEALRNLGHDARMLVCDKLSDAPFVEVCAPALKMKIPFLKERLGIYLKNGRNRETLFKIDTATDGLPLWRHPLVKEADAIFLGWVNQGMLSLKGVRRLCGLGKPVVWIMHDMWNMTGICHHAANCTGFHHSCGDCPLLGIYAKDNDISRQTWENKDFTYQSSGIKFVAVSTWLASKAKESALMRNLPVTVIPNAFDLAEEKQPLELITEATSEGMDSKKDTRVRVIFGGARLDDPIKGLPVLKKVLAYIRDRHPHIADDMLLVTFGTFKNPESNSDFAIAHEHLGVLNGSYELSNAYKHGGIVVSTSDYETLPGTLVEGQAYGCIPVAIDHGGQRDIIDHLRTGWLATWNDSPSIRAEEVAKGLVWAYGVIKSQDLDQVRMAMKESVREKFSATKVAQRILDLTAHPNNNTDY